jgi:predicted transcriptional regulator
MSFGGEKLRSSIINPILQPNQQALADWIEKKQTAKSGLERGEVFGNAVLFVQTEEQAAERATQFLSG